MDQGGAANRIEGRRSQRFNDALSYVRQVKHEFLNEPEVFDEFTEILREFRSWRIDIPDVMQRVANLFRGHPALIDGFNNYLPGGYRIVLPAPDEAPAS